jgi:LEA14-like dessication related protein
MFKKINRKQFVLFILLNGLIVCGIIALSFRKPTFIKVNHSELVSVTDSFFNFRVNMALKNANFFSISGKDLAIQLGESERIFGEGSIEPFHLSKSSESDLDITMKLNYREVIRSYNAQTSDTLIPSVSITGSFMPGFFIHKINLNKKISRSEIFRVLMTAFNGRNAIKADSFSINKLGAFETEINFAILFTNSIDLTFSIKKIDATIYPSESSNLSLGNVSLANNIVLPAKEKVAVPLQLMVDNVSLVRAMLQSGLKTFDSFFARGNMVIEIGGEQAKVPFELPFGKPVQ